MPVNKKSVLMLNILTAFCCIFPRCGSGGSDSDDKNLAPAADEPVFSLEEGIYSSDQTLTITCTTADATIYYTDDGTVPNYTSPEYTSPISIAGEGTETVKAFAVKTGMVDSDIVSATYTISYPPSPPAGLTATALSSSSISLSWADNSGNETGFIIERSLTGSGTGFSTVANVSANTTAWTDTRLCCETHYYYRIKAINAGGNSSYSDESSAVTQSAGLVINEIGCLGTEFIEIYNGTSSVIDITGYSFRILNSSGTQTYSISLTTALLASSINPHGYSVWYTASSLLGNTSGGLAMVNDSTQQVIDSLSWNCVISSASLSGFTNPVAITEGMPSVKDSAITTSLVRIPNAVDTNDNSADFFVTTTRTQGSTNVLTP